MSGIPLRSADNGTVGLVGTAFFSDDGGAQATLSAQHETDGSAQLIGPHFVSGFDGSGQWESCLKIMNVGRTSSMLFLELVDTAGSRLYTQDVSLAPDGQAQLVLSSLLPADRFASGSDGYRDRSRSLVLQPGKQVAATVPQFLGIQDYQRLQGYLEVRASDPISSLVLYGDKENRILSTIPATLDVP